MDQLTFYRSSNAVEFAPTRTDKAQVVFVKFAESLYQGRPQAGQPKFGWRDAVVLALKPLEVMGLAHGCEMVLSGKTGENPIWQTYHDHQGVAKTMQLTWAHEGSNYPTFLRVQSGERRVAVGMNTDDLFMMAKLFPLAVAAIMGWTTSEVPSWMSEDYQEPAEAGEAAVRQTTWDKEPPPAQAPLADGETAIGKIRNLWHEQLRKGREGEPSESQLNLLRWKLVEVFEPDPDARVMAKTVIKNVFNADSSQDLDSPMVSALLDWLLRPKTKSDDPLRFRPYAAEEARAIVVMG
jgi:hypothetical protein